MFRKTLSLVALSSLLAAAPVAQTPTNLIGLTNANSLLVKQDANTATCPVTRCVTAIPATPIVGQPAGGTACDGDRSGVWITNGTELRLVDSNTCQDRCPNPIIMPGQFTASIVTGLAYSEPTNSLFVVDARSRFYRFTPTVTATGGCTLLGGLICDASTGVHPIGSQIAGLAINDVTGMVYFTSSDFAAANPNNILYVAPMTSPCTPICRIPFRQCGNSTLGPIRGAGYDPCTRTTWVTDGRQQAGYRVNTVNCQMNNVACCPLNLPSNDIYVGLCVRPSESTPVGQSCTQAPCANCPNMVHTTSWAAIGGVLHFDLANAPAPSQVILGLGFGPCQSPGFPLPFLCAPIRVFLGPPAPIFAGGFGVPGSGCNGNKRISVPVPLDPSLCGFVLSSQYIVGCVSTGSVGFGITNCVNTAISGT